MPAADNQVERDQHPFTGVLKGVNGAVEHCGQPSGGAAAALPADQTRSCQLCKRSNNWPIGSLNVAIAASVGTASSYRALAAAATIPRRSPKKPSMRSFAAAKPSRADLEHQTECMFSLSFRGNEIALTNPSRSRIPFRPPGLLDRGRLRSHARRNSPSTGSCRRKFSVAVPSVPSGPTMIDWPPCDGRGRSRRSRFA